MLGNLVMDEGGSAGRKRKFFFLKKIRRVYWS
jgi:hypothetical protein